MQHIARVVPTEHLHQELKHLSLDLGKPVQELLAEGVILLLRHHDRGAGLPEPEPLKPSSPSRATKKGALDEHSAQVGRPSAQAIRLAAQDGITADERRSHEQIALFEISPEGVDRVS